MLSEYAEYPGGRSTWYSKYQSSMYSMSDELEPEETLYTPRIGPAINDGNNSSAPKSSNAVTSTKPSIKKTRFVYEPSLPARLNGREISAFPDIGAPANFIALRYVRDRGLSINFAARKLVKTPVGTTIIIIGTVILQFSFEDECKCHTKSHRLEFNVINKPVRDVIVGSPFLDLTQTFTRNVHRIRQNLRKIRLPRICFLGSRQHVMGHVNGIHVDAMPDTGADVPVMSLSFAERHGFIVNTSPRHQTLLEFLNGSTANSIGVVDVEWQFESSKTLHRIHAFVLKELQTDLILDNTFLHDTNAFISHEEDFSTCICWRRRFENYWMISIIKLVGSVLKYSKWRNSSTPPLDTTKPPDEARRLEKSRQLNAYGLARKHAQGMTEDQRIAFLQPHLAQGKQFLEASQSSLPMATSLPSLAAGASVPVVSTVTVGRRSFFSKLRRPKRKPSTPAVNPPAVT